MTEPRQERPQHVHAPTVAALTAFALVVPVVARAAVVPSDVARSVDATRGSVHLLVVGVWVTVIVFGRRPSPFRTLALSGLLAGPLVVVAGAALAISGPPPRPALDAAAVLGEMTRWAAGGAGAGLVATVILRLGRS